MAQQTTRPPCCAVTQLASRVPAAGLVLRHSHNRSARGLQPVAAAPQPSGTQTAHRRTAPAAAPVSGGASTSACRTPLQAVAQTAAVLPPHRTPSPSPSSVASNLLSRAQAIVSGFVSSPHDGIIFSLAAPAILALAADPLLAMVDTAIVGHLGQNELGALGVNNSLFGFAFIVFNFLSTATTPMVAAALSAGDKTKAGETIMQALGLATVLGITVTVGLTAQADSALQLMGLPIDGTGDPQMTALARDFLMVRATAAPAALLVTVSQGVFRGLQDMRTPLAVTLATNVIHLVLSLLFIFPGHWGVTGAAASTSIAEWLAAATYLALGWGRRQELGLDPWPQMDVKKAWKQYLPFLQAGGAVLMRTAVLLGTKTLASAVATRLGPASIASHQVLTQVWSMSSLLIDSLGISGQTLVAVSLGQGDRKTARKVTDRLLQLGIALGIGLSAILALLGPAWPQLFTQDHEVLDLVQQLMPLAIWMLPLNAMVYVLDGVLVGASDFQFLVGAMVLASGAAASLLLSVEPLQLGLAGVWGAQVVLMAGRAATLGARYWSESGPLPPSQAGDDGVPTYESLASGSYSGLSDEEDELDARSSGSSFMSYASASSMDGEGSAALLASPSSACVAGAAAMAAAAVTAACSSSSGMAQEEPSCSSSSGNGSSNGGSSSSGSSSANGSASARLEMTFGASALAACSLSEVQAGAELDVGAGVPGGFVPVPANSPELAGSVILERAPTVHMGGPSAGSRTTV